jgi:hypothetical protein
MKPVAFSANSIRLSPSISGAVEETRLSYPQCQMVRVEISWSRPEPFYIYCYWQKTGFIPPSNDSFFPDSILFGAHLADSEFLRDIVDVLFTRVTRSLHVMDWWPNFFEGIAAGYWGLERRRDDDSLVVLVETIVSNASLNAKNLIRCRRLMFPSFLEPHFSR